jgi:chaperonin GroES
MKPSQIKPRGAWVLVQLDNKPEKSTGGIFLPDDVRKNQQDRMGVILAMGPHCNANAALSPPIAVGQRVAINFFSGTRLDDKANKLPDGDYRCVKEEDVIAIVSPE